MNFKWKKLNREIFSEDNIERIFSPTYNPESPIVLDRIPSPVPPLPGPGRPGGGWGFGAVIPDPRCQPWPWCMMVQPPSIRPGLPIRQRSLKYSYKIPGNRKIYNGNMVVPYFRGNVNHVIRNKSSIQNMEYVRQVVPINFNSLHISYYAEHWRWVDGRGWVNWQHQIKTRKDIEIIYNWGNRPDNFAKSDCAKLGGTVDKNIRQIALKVVFGAGGANPYGPGSLHTKYFNVNRDAGGRLIKPYTNSSCYPPNPRFNEIGFSYLSCWKIGRPPSIPLFGEPCDSCAKYC